MVFAKEDYEKQQAKKIDEIQHKTESIKEKVAVFYEYDKFILDSENNKL